LLLLDEIATGGHGLRIRKSSSVWAVLIYLSLIGIVSINLKRIKLNILKMKKLLLALSIAAFISATSCSRGSSDTQKQSTLQESGTNSYYTCTMHPEVHSDKPGNCPICGMTLVEKQASESDSVSVENLSDSIHSN
jgi:hypothetical protein